MSFESLCVFVVVVVVGCWSGLQLVMPSGALRSAPRRPLPEDFRWKCGKLRG